MVTDSAGRAPEYDQVSGQPRDQDFVELPRQNSRLTADAIELPDRRYFSEDYNRLKKRAQMIGL